MHSKDIRKSFIEFFKSKSHEVVTSAPLMPSSPNLLFTNAGMNAFVPYFLNEVKPPFLRITNSQKCIRAGGKHNDLEDVGFDTYHHTFFEMLGNWSIGNYFKKEAIYWSWELLTEVWGFPKPRLYVTVYKPENDEPFKFDLEAYEYWKEIFNKEGLDPDTHIHFGNKKDNFWMMGETGPCGPCSEIHIDLTPDGSSNGDLVNKDSPWCIEIWNLVFIQLNAQSNGEYTPLPQCHVDTGMGFERIAGILATTKNFKDFSNPPSNYNSDLFLPIFKKIETMSGYQYNFTIPANKNLKDNTELIDCAFRVISDHIRTLCFSIADGILPGNEGRNYVLRRILRRAILYGKKLNLQEGFFSELSEIVVDQFKLIYPEIEIQKNTIKKVISTEEFTFHKTLERGLQLFEKMSAKGSISGKEAFNLYDTYGFPFDLTELLANEKNISINDKDFYIEMEEQRKRARKAHTKDEINTIEAINYPETIFKGFNIGENPFSAKLLGVENIGKNNYAVILDQTIFFGEMGGQKGDIGNLITPTGSSYPIVDTKINNGVILHIIKTEKFDLDVGAEIELLIDFKHRKSIERHHSATHLLQWALIKVLGKHIKQSGSQVSQNKLRFDFSHFESISQNNINEIEHLVNSVILENVEVKSSIIKYKDKPEDVIAVFGEKYGSKVRLVDIGGFSKELCGGTHVKSVGEIGSIRITSESAISSGTRRIEAMCGEASISLSNEQKNLILDLSKMLKCKNEELKNRFEKLILEKEDLEKKVKIYEDKIFTDISLKLIKNACTIDNGLNTSFIHGPVEVSDAEALRLLANKILSKINNCIVLISTTSKENSKIAICSAVSEDLIKVGFNAGFIIKDVCSKLGGKGGGKENFAMGSVDKNQQLIKLLKNYKPETKKV